MSFGLNYLKNYMGFIDHGKACGYTKSIIKITGNRSHMDIKATLVFNPFDYAIPPIA